MHALHDPHIKPTAPCTRQARLQAGRPSKVHPIAISVPPKR